MSAIKKTETKQRSQKHSRVAAPTPGSALASKAPIKKRGVLIPADNSFEAINRFVNCFPSPQYEELQWALLGIADKIERLDEAVKWALGENGDFAQRPEGAGAYWWRTELRKRAYEVPNAT
jgi:hypothetical protein